MTAPGLPCAGASSAATLPGSAVSGAAAVAPGKAGVAGMAGVAGDGYETIRTLQEILPRLAP